MPKYRFTLEIDQLLFASEPIEFPSESAMEAQLRRLVVMTTPVRDTIRQVQEEVTTTAWKTL